MKQRQRQNRALDEGSAILEFSLSLVVVLTVLIGIIDIGRALYAYDWVSTSARQATRFMMVRGTGCSQLPDGVILPGGCPATAGDATNYVKSLGVGIDTSRVTVITRCFATGGALIPPPCAPRGWVNVQVQYRFGFISPFLAISPWSMTSTSQLVVQN